MQFANILVLSLSPRFSQPDLPRPFRLPLALPLFFVLVLAVLLAFPVYFRPAATGLCFAFVASGLPVYFLLVRPEEKPVWLASAEQWTVHAVQKLFMAVPEEEEEEEDKVEIGVKNEAFEKRE